jgi:hypothetical protein
MKRSCALIVALLSFLVLTIQLTPSFGYDCLRIRNLKKAQKESFLENDLIFIGEATVVNSDGSYQLKIIEILKGNLNDSVVVGGVDKFFALSPFEIGETWLVYTIKNHDGSITIPDCGLSRSTRFPFYFGSPYSPPPPPPLEYSLPIFELEIVRYGRLRKALKELQREVELIRKWEKKLNKKQIG